VLPTAWQAVAYADPPEGGSLAVWGLGPIGQMACRIARHQGAGRVIGVDFVPERLEMARRHGVETVDVSAVDDAATAVREMTGRGVDAAIDAVGMEASGSKLDSILQFTKLQMDRLEALRTCMGSIRRGGTLSISGVYAGHLPLVPIGELFDRQLTIRMGQANVRRWTDELLPLVLDGDPLGTEDLATHHLPLENAPRAYEMFQKKTDGAIKVVLHP
jgi:threonine dehydrogenase-like Zn-dependent dehydrogenase